MLAICFPCQAANVGNMRLWAAPDSTRVVFDISEPVQHSLFKINGPPRVVLDIRNARVVGSLGSVANNVCLAQVRSGLRNTNDLRLVLDLHQSVEVKSFIAGPSGPYGHRLVVDLIGQKKNLPTPVSAIPAAPKKTLLTLSNSGERVSSVSAKEINTAEYKQPVAHPTPVPTPVVHTPTVSKISVPKNIELGSRAGRDIVVAVDAGHGGEDPGAIGQRRVREKDVVLKIARKLAALVEREPGMQAVLIRDGDYFVPLRDRMKKARQHKADLFVSIHADAVLNRDVRGSSVYVLSERGASNEQARWLAARENASDLIGGVSLGGKDGDLKEVLLDMSQAGAMDASYDVANHVLRRLAKVGSVHYRQVQAAGFMVLKSPDVPSLLVETAYITNPSEENKLIDPRHQDVMASAIMDGIRAYFKDRAPPGTRLAMGRDFLQR
jgi:N-acetylmuramoyl-L-alanine amidase